MPGMRLRSIRDHATERSHWVVMLVENEGYPDDVRVRSEAETLAAAGYRVTVVAPRGRDEVQREHLNGVDVVRFWLPATSQTVLGFLVEYAIAHLQIVRLTIAHLLRGADVVHLANPPDTLGIVLAMARLLRRRAVFDNHDLFPELFALRYGENPLVKVLRAAQRACFRWANLVLTTNESQRELVVAASGRDPATVVVVRNGPLRDTIAPPLGTRLPSPMTGPGRPHLLFLGALEPQDGAVTLADVLSELVGSHALDPKLTVVGAGSCEADLALACERLGVRDRVTFTGRIPFTDVPSMLAASDICVDPAPCNELNNHSTMVKIAEYLAAEKPVVAYALRETMVTAGSAALYARCGDTGDFAAKIATIAVQPEVSAQLVASARARTPELVWERSAEVLLDAYRRLLRPMDASGDAPMRPEVA